MRRWFSGLSVLVGLGYDRDIRELDMRASPYDLRDWGYDAVPIETAEGKAAYVRAQRGFAERGQVIRAKLVDIAAG